MRRRLRFPALAIAAVGLVLALLPATAGAADVAAAGWWSRTSAGLPLNPTAPNAGEGQLAVQGEPSGANAIAALRWELAEGESSPTLTITAAEGSVVPAESLILACKAGSPWTEAQGGPMEEAPKVDCGTSVNGVVAEDGTITFALGALLNGTTLDIVLTPGTTPEGFGSPFSLVFDRPASDALTTTGGSGGDETAFDPGSAGGDFSSSPSGSSDFAPSSGGGDSSFSPPAGDSGSSFTPPATGAGGAAEPALPPESQVAMDTGTGEAAAVPGAQNAGSASDDRDKVRTLGIVVLLAGAAVAAWGFLAAAPAGAAASALPAAGAAAPPTSGGLGRFVRPRTGAPPSLS